MSALIASGLADESWFAKPTERDARGRTVRKKRIVVDGREVLTYAPAKGSAWVHIHRTAKEAASRAPEAAPEKNVARNLGTKPQKETLLLNLERRLNGCASVIGLAADDVRDKREKHPAERPEELVGSSKLGRALHELDIAQRDIGAVIMKLREVVGPDELACEEDDD